MREPHHLLAQCRVFEKGDGGNQFCLISSDFFCGASIGMSASRSEPDPVIGAVCVELPYIFYVISSNVLLQVMQKQRLEIMVREMLGSGVINRPMR